MRPFISFFSYALIVLCAAPSVGRAQDPAAQIEQGSSLYADRCALCHGTNGETKAMGRGQAIMLMPRADIEAKLAEYQFVTDPKGMKAKMKAGLSTEEIEAISAFLTERK